VHAVELLGHQGGWDEALLVAAPMVFVGWLLRLAKKRMNRSAQHAAPTDRTASADAPAPHDPAA
jgi:hypothetical protein